MTWRRRPLSAVAPAMPSNRVIEDKRVWSLTLDQIESHTGQILTKKYIDADSIPPSTHFFDEGNVLYSKLRPYLNKVYVPQECGVATSELVPLRPDPSSLHRKFLSYFLRSHEFLSFATACVAGAKMPRMVMRRMWNYEIPVPHLKEQARIVELLDQADALRKLRHQADDKAARILPALFHHYFGDPQKNDKRYPLGRIAEHSTRVTKGESPKWQGFAYQDSGVLFVTSENVRLGSLDISNPKYVAPGFHKKLKRSALIEDDVLVNLVGASIGRCCIYRNMKSPANINQAVAAITLTKDSLLPDFLEALLCQPSMQAKLLGHRVEAARANISLKDVRELEIIIPDIEEQIKFCDAAVAIKETHHAIATSKQKLEDLFQLLLHRAFTGELTATWREAHLSELVEEMEIQAKG